MGRDGQYHQGGVGTTVQEGPPNIQYAEVGSHRESLHLEGQRLRCQLYALHPNDETTIRAHEISGRTREAKR